MKYSRVKDFTVIINGVGVNPEVQGNPFGEIPFFRNSDFSKEGNELYLQNSESNFSFEEIKQYGFRLAPKNSLVFSKVGESIRKNHRKFTKNISVIDNNLSAFLINKKINKQYFYWLFKTIDFANYLVPSTIPVLNTSLVKNIVVPQYSLPQQTAIANYLDHHTTNLDKEISLLEQKVEKLDEYKQALIYEIVTKGLDKNVPMKDSGIEWIGMIPEHWEVKRVKDFYKLGMGETILKEDLIENGKYPIYSATAEDKFFGYLNDLNLILKKDDLVIPARGNSIGHVKLVKQPLGCTQTTIYLKKKNKINSSYIYYYLIGNKSELFFFDDTAIPQITVAQINRKMILLPQKNEQQQIAEYLDEQCSKINKKKELINKKVELLKEYKQSLIYEAVTGATNIESEYFIENNFLEQINEDVNSFLMSFQKSFTPTYEIKTKEDLEKIKKELKGKKYGNNN